MVGVGDRGDVRENWKVHDKKKKQHSSNKVGAEDGPMDSNIKIPPAPEEKGKWGHNMCRPVTLMGKILFPQLSCQV